MIQYAIYTLLALPKISGPVNIVSPEPMRQTDWINQWATLSFRPSFLPLPTVAIKKVMGEMGQELLLQSTRAIPEILQKINFRFKCHSFKELFTLYKL